MNSNKDLRQILQLLGDSTRYKMFRILSAKHDLCVSEIAERLNISVPAASQHFRAMENAGLVLKKRDGQKMCYMLDDEDAITKTLIKLMKRED
ncbi:MAG: metalloregulator ArsR/SmtB family transcription factor [bacterium]|nr:metalloregulator ArsR/SmtB family transcription factor [bacterium]